MTLQMESNNRYSENDWMKIQRHAMDQEVQRRISTTYDMKAVDKNYKTMVALETAKLSGSGNQRPVVEPEWLKAVDGRSKGSSRMTSLPTTLRSASAASLGTAVSLTNTDFQAVPAAVLDILSRGAAARVSTASGGASSGQTPTNMSRNPSGPLRSRAAENVQGSTGLKVSGGRPKLVITQHFEGCRRAGGVSPVSGLFLGSNH